MASCSFPASFIMLSLCTAASLPGRELSLSCSLSVQLATHPRAWVTSCVLCSVTPQPPFPLGFTVTAPTPKHPGWVGLDTIDEAQLRMQIYLPPNTHTHKKQLLIQSSMRSLPFISKQAESFRSVMRGNKLLTQVSLNSLCSQWHSHPCHFCPSSHAEVVEC